MPRHGTKRGPVPHRLDVAVMSEAVPRHGGRHMTWPGLPLLLGAEATPFHFTSTRQVSSQRSFLSFDVAHGAARRGAPSPRRTRWPGAPALCLSAARGVVPLRFNVIPLHLWLPQRCGTWSPSSGYCDDVDPALLTFPADAA